MKKTKHAVAYRRKRKGLTNYKKRLKLLLANKPRLVIRKSLKNIGAQIIEYNKKGDKVLISAHSSNLDKFGWKMGKSNLPSAYLVGLLVGKKAKEKGINELIMDIGLNKSVKGSRIYALLKGVVDSKIEIPHSGDMLPDESRIKGEHIEKYASKSIKKYFEETRNKILGA